MFYNYLKKDIKIVEDFFGKFEVMVVKRQMACG